jgi:AraC-like DNA-binding protein
MTATASPRPSATVPVRRVRHHGAGLDEAQRLGESLYHPHRLCSLEPGQPLTLTADVVQAGPITVGTLGYSCPVRVDTEAYGSAYQVNLALDTPIDTAVGTTRLRMTPARAVVYRPDVPTSFSGWRRPGRMLAVKIDRRRLESVANAYLGRDKDEPLPMSAPLDVSEGPGRDWLIGMNRLTVLARAALHLPDASAAAGFITQLADEACLRLAIASSPEAAWDADAVPAPPDAVHRCVELMDGLPELDLTLKDLADYAGTSGRSLQLAFRSRFDTTPMQHLRSIRLDRVRDDLRNPGLAGLGVAEIARGRGFRHPGRFAQDYQSRFGVLPSADRG